MGYEIKLLLMIGELPTKYTYTTAQCNSRI